jgi:hypothetical protein
MAARQLNLTGAQGLRDIFLVGRISSYTSCMTWTPTYCVIKAPCGHAHGILYSPFKGTTRSCTSSYTQLLEVRLWI